MTLVQLRNHIQTHYLSAIRSFINTQTSAALSSVQRTRALTEKALHILDSIGNGVFLWGYSSAFNPLAYVETTLPPDFHYLIQIGEFVVDPIRSVLKDMPVVYSLKDVNDQLCIVSAYGDPVRWLSCSRDFGHFLWSPEDTPSCSVLRYFNEKIPLEPGLLQVRYEHSNLCTLPANHRTREFVQILCQRLPLAGCKESTLHQYDGTKWVQIHKYILPPPAVYFDQRLKAIKEKTSIYRLPGDKYAWHLISAALGVPQANRLMRSLTTDMAMNETRAQKIQNLFELRVSSSPYNDGDFAYHVREIAADPVQLRPLYIDAARPTQSFSKAGPSKQFGSRRRGRSQNRAM